MNWYKRAQQVLEQTLPYFEEFKEYGDYVPDLDLVNQNIEEFGSITGEKGRGDSGIAYTLSNGDILKITTNKKEGRNADWLVNNPHPNIADYKKVWKEGDLYYIIMENLDPIPKEMLVALEAIKKYLESYGWLNIQKAPGIIRNQPSIMGSPYGNLLLDYFEHIFSLDPTDFLNLNNIGSKNGVIKFFDIT